MDCRIINRAWSHPFRDVVQMFRMGGMRKNTMPRTKVANSCIVLQGAASDLEAQAAL